MSEVAARRPSVALAAAGLVTLALGGGLPRVEIDSSIDTMVVDGSSAQAFQVGRNKLFGSDEVVSIAFPFKSAAAPEALAVQRRIAEAIERLPGIREVSALPTALDVVGRDGVLEIQPLFPAGTDPKAVSSEERKKLRRRVESNPIWPGWLVSRDGRTAALQVRFASSTAGRVASTENLAAIERIIQKEQPGKPYYIAGHPFMKAEIARTISRDLMVLLPVALLVMAVLLVILTRCWRTTTVLLTGVLLSILWMFGAMGWAGLDLTAMSNTAPIILLALSAAHFMHLAAATQRETREGVPPWETSRRAVHRVYRALWIAALTTALGYASLSISSVPIVRGFGLTLALGVLAILGVGLFVLPAAFALLPPRRDRGLFRPDRCLGGLLFRVARITTTRPQLVLVVGVLLGVIALYSASYLEVDSSGPKRFPTDSRFRESAEFYRASLSGDVLENVYLSASPGHFLDPGVLRNMRAFQREAEALPEVDKTLSVADYIVLMNRAMFEDDLEQARIPGSRHAVAQYLLLYSSSEDLDHLIEAGYGEARIALMATVQSSSESAALREKLQLLAQRYFPESYGRHSVLSTEILLSQAAETISREQLRSFLLALGLIILTIVFAFGSLRAGLYAVVPNGLPIALNLGVMAALGIPLSDATSIISATTLGIAADGTIHLLVSIRHGEAVYGSRDAAVTRALLTTGRPVVVTGVLVVVGFSVLLLSDFRSVAQLGGLTALTMVYCLVADLFVLPGQLCAWARDSGIVAAGQPGVLALTGGLYPVLAFPGAGSAQRIQFMDQASAPMAPYAEMAELRTLKGSARWGCVVAEWRGAQWFDPGRDETESGELAAAPPRKAGGMR